MAAAAGSEARRGSGGGHALPAAHLAEQKSHWGRQQRGNGRWPGPLRPHASAEAVAGAHGDGQSCLGVGMVKYTQSSPSATTVAIPSKGTVLVVISRSRPLSSILLEFAGFFSGNKATRTWPETTSSTNSRGMILMIPRPGIGLLVPKAPLAATRVNSRGFTRQLVYKLCD